MARKPEVTCYLCRRTFQKKVEGAAHNRNYYRCSDCLKGLRNMEETDGREDGAGD